MVNVNFGSVGEGCECWLVKLFALVVEDQSLVGEPREVVCFRPDEVP